MTIPSILPPNASSLLKDLEQASAKRLIPLQDTVLRYVNNPNLCPVHLLPWLAWAVSVDVWNNDWPLETKQAIIRQSVQIHKQKGTIGALRRALSAFSFVDIRIEEWFNYGGAPFKFRVFAELLEAEHSLIDLDMIYTTIMQTKNLRSHLESFIAEIETISDTPYVAAAVGMLEKTTIYPLE